MSEAKLSDPTQQLPPDPSCPPAVREGDCVVTKSNEDQLEILEAKVRVLTGMIGALTMTLVCKGLISLADLAEMEAATKPLSATIQNNFLNAINAANSR